jgi:hypothetical protein
VAASLPATDPRRAQLLDVVPAELAGAAPVRPVVAAAILQLKEKTVRDDEIGHNRPAVRRRGIRRR